MQRLSQVQQANARFVERKYLHILTEPREFRGTLRYVAPGHLEKHTLSPPGAAQSLVLDGDTLTVENAITGQRRSLALERYPVLRAFVESIRATLAGDLQGLRRFYRVSLEGDAQAWRLLLRPTEPQMQQAVSDIRIRGSGDWIDRIEILEADGDRSVMTIRRDRQ